MSNDLIAEKRCTRCGEIKPREAFSKDKSRKDGLQNPCKACVAAFNAAYYAVHRDKIRAHNAAYRAANPDKERARKDAHYAAHRDETRARVAAYKATHRDAIRAHNAVYRDAHRHQAHAYRAANPDIFHASNHRRRARIKGNGGAGVSHEELAALRAAQSVFCAYCQLPWIAPLHIDHVIPLVEGGPHEIANIVLACPDCNGEKSGRTPEQWTNRWYERRIDKTDKN